MDSKEDYLYFKPNPPPNLSKDLHLVWLGWSCKGDREVAREAAAKGLHIELVKLFLKSRRKIQINDAELYFTQEVMLWVDELLERQQIFRATHVLKNVGFDPVDELNRIFYVTAKKDLREYIGNHLIKLEVLSELMKQLWHLLDLILRNNVLISKYKLSQESIQCLNSQTDQWKFEISAKLFLRTHDILLEPFLNPEVLWKQLLIYNDTKLLINWINIKYNHNLTDYGLSENLVKIFTLFDISNDMLNLLNNFDSSANTRNIVLNEFSKFGIFSECDQNNFVNILKRLNNSDNIVNIFKILSYTSANISIDNFTNLFISYCLDNEFYTILNVYLGQCNLSPITKSIQSIHLELIENFKYLISNFDESILRDNLLLVSKFLAKDFSIYFSDNVLIFLALIFFTKETTFSAVLQNSHLQIKDLNLSNAIEGVLSKLPLVKNFAFKPIENRSSFYELLEKHVSIDIGDIFAFQFNSELEMPHFNSTSISSNFGYSKKVNYLFYVKQSRPSIACKWFIINQLTVNQSIRSEDLDQASKKTYKLALRNFSCNEIAASAITFLELLGVSSEFVRVSVSAANFLSQSGWTQSDIFDLFISVNEPYAIQNALETVLVEKIGANLLSTGAELVDSIQTYEIVMKYSTIYNLKLPELFLKHCATNNLWLPFLLFAQIRNYPIDQIKLVTQSMKNPNLLEHVNHSVVHEIQANEQNTMMRERDSRKYFLSRIGVRKNIDALSLNSDSLISSIASQSSFGSGHSSSGSDFLEIDLLNTKATLLQTLIRCHNSTDPPRALLHACQLYRVPLLAIFATSYEPDSVVTNWLTWLAVSTEITETYSNFESISICANSVLSLLNCCMERQFPVALLNSFEIFLPDNPLKLFLEFLNMCIAMNFDMLSLKSKLDAFKTALHKSRRISVITTTDHEMTYLSNKLWIENTALVLLTSALNNNCYSLYNKIIFLDSICKIQLPDYFSIECPNFKSMLEILQIIHQSKCNLKFDLSEAFDVRNNRKPIIECINGLLESELFESALKIAQIENLPLDLILIKQWQYKFSNRDANDAISFWTKCNSDFLDYKITADCVIDFYLNCLDALESHYEKYMLVKFSYEWSLKYQLSNRYELEMKMWIMYVSLDDDKQKDLDHLNNKQSGFLFKEAEHTIEELAVYGDDLNPDVTSRLQNLLQAALNKENFALALKLEKMFNLQDADLDILKLCFRLAEGTILPYNLNTEQRILLSKGANFRRLSNRRTYLSTRLSSFSSASHSPANAMQNALDAVDAPIHDTLAILQTLSEKLTNGCELAHKILMTYRISINIEIPYHVVVSNSDNMKMLKDSLEDDCMNKLEVVHDFIQVYQWSKDEIADFLCEEIVNATTYYIRSKTDNYILWDLNVDQDFNLVLQLLQDNCSILGYKIYAYASALHKIQATTSTDFKISELALVTFLLIAAHDCFTADCNMKGISTILKKCQTVIAHLLTVRSWKLIVRLLTGVARYTEMNYVFHILKENDQFEFLLRKGSRKDNGLKIALLEYLKKHCPDNKELYKLVALHFALFSEVALLWEREAQSVIKNLIAISKLEMQNNKLNPDVEAFVLVSNSDGTRICLNKAMENYTHATEFHLQGEKLAKAMNAAKQAELLALQLSLLRNVSSNQNASTNCILNLNNLQIASLISTQLTFEQSHILIEAYNYTADWATVLFEQCIIQNNKIYLDGFLQHLTLTDALVNDISRKFLSNNINTPMELNCMKYILTKLPSVHTKYRIASELGFTDLVEDLISGDQLAYLKDTVWKRGYKN